MNNTIIENWNSIVGIKDTVYHLGDFGIGRQIELLSIMDKLHGSKIVIKGTHDKNLTIPIGNHIVTENLLTEIDTNKIFLSHYLHKVWPESHYGSWHLCGHSHGAQNEYIAKEGKIIDVGVDSFDFKPISFEQVCEIMSLRPNNYNFEHYV